MDTAESCPALALPNRNWAGICQPGTLLGFPMGFLLRENTFPVLLVWGGMWDQQWHGYPWPWPCFQPHAGLQEQLGQLHPCRELLSRWCCPRCQSRLPTNPGRMWLLLLLLEEEEGQCWLWCFGFPSRYPGQDPPSAS